MVRCFGAYCGFDNYDEADGWLRVSNRMGGTAGSVWFHQGGQLMRGGLVFLECFVWC